MYIHSASSLAGNSSRRAEFAAPQNGVAGAELKVGSDGGAEGSSPSGEGEGSSPSGGVRAFSGALKSYFRLVLLDALSSIEGRKLLFLDESLASALGSLVEASALQQRGVERCFALGGAFPLDASSLSPETAAAPSVLFLCKGRLSKLALIERLVRHVETTFPPASQPPPSAGPEALGGRMATVSADPLPSAVDASREGLLWSLPKPPALSQTGRQFFVVLIPSASEFFASELKRRLSAATTEAHSQGADSGGPSAALPAAAASLLSSIGTSLLPISAPTSAQPSASERALSTDCLSVSHCPLYFFPLAEDVVSLEQPNFFRAVHAMGDSAPCREAAEALFFLQEIQEEGVIPQLRCIGSAAKAVADGLVRRRREAQRVAALKTEASAESGASAFHGGAELQRFPGSLSVPPVFEALSERDMDESCSAEEGLEESSSSMQPNCGSVSEGGAFHPRLRARPVMREAGADSLQMAVLFDRRVDLVTPLCTPFTYEGLLDAVLGVEAGAAVMVPSQLLQNSQSSQSSQAAGEAAPSTEVKLGERQRVLLGTDALFRELRDLHQTQVGAALHRVASEIQRTYEEKESLRTIADISSFMPRFKAKQQEHSSLSVHVKLASFLSAVAKSEAFHRRLCFEDALLQNAQTSGGGGPGAALGVGGGGFEAFVASEMEDLIDESAQTEVQAAAGVRCFASASLSDVYRLLCLSSLVNGGLRHKTLLALQSLIVQQHGIAEVRRMALMHKVGLLRDSLSASASAKTGGSGAAAQGPQRWKTIREKLRLLVDDSNQAPAAEDDVAYVCSGYAPLSVR